MQNKDSSHTDDCKGEMTIYWGDTETHHTCLLNKYIRKRGQEKKNTNTIEA